MDLKHSRVAVTGATGFLGGYLVDTLLARGARVAAVVRNPDKARPLAARGVDVRKADLLDPAALERAFADIDAVIANAALISFTNPRETMHTNVEGARNVFDALPRAGVKRAIAISSTSAYPWSPFLLDESVPLRDRPRVGRLSAYGESKARAERLAWESCEAHGIALTTFRPCGITGPSDPLLMGTLEKLMRLPIIPFPAFTYIGVVHAADVAEAVALALEKPERSAGKAYNLQGHTVSLWAVGDAWRRAGGRVGFLRVPVPVPVALRFDDTRARAELGWTPRTLEQIFVEAVNARGPG